MKSFVQKPYAINKQWVLIDADGLVLGRLAAFIASRLRGKHLHTYTPHVDDGDNIIVVNAEKIVLTGRKYYDKLYYWHTGYVGGVKQRSARQLIEGRSPETVIKKAVQGMLPSGPLARRQMANLRVYKGSEHPHTAQQPLRIDVGAFNTKNRANRKVSVASMSSVIMSNSLGGDYEATIGQIFRHMNYKTINDIDDDGYSTIVRGMDNAKIDNLLNNILLRLDSSDPELLSQTLTELSFIIPRLDLQQCRQDSLLRSTLRSIPDRLLATLSENLAISRVAKKAAFALVAAIYPDHYSETLGAPEDVARADLESIFEGNAISWFLTLEAEPHDQAATIDARLWNEVSFELNGVKPSLAKRNSPSRDGVMSLDVSGADVLNVHALPPESLADGQLAGLKASIRPNKLSGSRDRVILELRRQNKIYGHEVFDTKVLFPSFR